MDRTLAFIQEGVLSRHSPESRAESPILAPSGWLEDLEIDTPGSMFEHVAIGSEITQAGMMLLLRAEGEDA